MKRISIPLLTSTFCLVLLVSCQSISSRNPAPVPPDLATPTLELHTSTPIKRSAVTPTLGVCQDTAGYVQEEELHGGQASDAVKIKIYLPPCYAAQVSTRYPVLYLLHGQDADNSQWINLGITRSADALITSGQIPPLIIVLPGEQNPLQEPEKSTFGSKIIEIVIPFMDDHYATCTTRSCRAIGGLSRGGNWAVSIGFAYPDLFTAVGAHSTPLFYGQAGQIKQAVAAMSEPSDAPFIYTDVGGKDKYYADVAAFVSTLKDLLVPYQYTEFAGKHDTSYWSAHVSDYLFWYTAQLNQAGSSLPPTPTP